ncbi:MAG TPA: NAD(P)H-dependent oxidoreductase [Candidatus Onthousia faecipullorum]|uniref:NAD(P)H-dependent oxidoreductase n=1 Tax=Candidatus Onthousia faecipullorum TaxID=2840887 RepID=A0A9D1KBS7_9FIRM|nr:NAD(P)H-dependent oxidoreductase [Candidatus Onthousia faecipullorum]
MMKILFMNSSPNREGNTYRIGEELLKDKEHDVLQMADYRISQYGQVFDDDEIKDVLKKIDECDVLVIGSPVYWYTVSGMLKTFIDRLYMLPEAETLRGKKLYLFAQGSAPNQDTVKSIEFLSNRLSYLMGMELKGVVTDSLDGKEILSKMKIEN